MLKNVIFKVELYLKNVIPLKTENRYVQESRAKISRMEKQS